MPCIALMLCSVEYEQLKADKETTLWRQNGNKPPAKFLGIKKAETEQWRPMEMMPWHRRWPGPVPAGRPKIGGRHD